MILEPPPFVLTLGFDKATLARLDALRREHFPRERNFIPAHATLFHALPGEHDALIRETLQAACSRSQVLGLSFPRLHFLGRGVAVVLECPGLPALRQGLAASWSELLTPQDRQGHRPHVTIQNKVAPQAARALFNRLDAQWEPFEGRSESLLLWRYRGGPWEAAGEFPLGEGRLNLDR